MGVNSDSENSAPRRIRRTPAEAKKLILAVAAERLANQGLEGLSISGVARQAGMSHATVIHHFGSTDAMRNALLTSMTRELLTDIMSALDQDDEPANILDQLFSTLSQDGHGKLLAWIALDQQALTAGEDNADLFADITAHVAGEYGERHARLLVYLVAIAAVGMSISGDAIAGLVGLSGEDRAAFPDWLAKHIQTL